MNGGIDGLVCSDHNATDTVFDALLNDTRPRQTCESLTIPDCHDRTIYCTFPPKSIDHGSKKTAVNPNEDGYENPTSMWLIPSARWWLKHIRNLSTWRHVIFNRILKKSGN